MGIAFCVFDRAVELADLVAAQLAPLAVGLHAGVVDAGEFGALFEVPGQRRADKVDRGTGPETAGGV